MSDITTIHENRNGEQVTTREVVLTDATGAETVYPFEVVDGDHHYVGEGDPSDRALEALADSEFTTGGAEEIVDQGDDEEAA